MNPAQQNKNKIENGIIYRHCNRCKEWLTLDHYGKRTQRDRRGFTEGLQASCKECMKAIGNARYAIKKSKEPV